MERSGGKGFGKIRLSVVLNFINAGTMPLNYYRLLIFSRVVDAAALLA
jgi:hypothetical protein